MHVTSLRGVVARSLAREISVCQRHRIDGIHLRQYGLAGNSCYAPPLLGLTVSLPETIPGFKCVRRRG